MKPMLAKDGDPSKLTYPVAAQIKLDGIRICVVDGVAVSRMLKPIPNKEIQGALGRQEFNGLDGEVIVGDPTAENCMQATTSFVMAPNKTGADWTYHVFDKWDETGNYDERWTAALGVLLEASTEPYGIPMQMMMVNYATCPMEADLVAFEKQAVAEGHEGVIVRTLDSPYKFGRSGTRGPLLKVKRFIDFEAEVIGVYEEMHNDNEAVTNALGRTERSTKKSGKIGKNTLGGIIVRAINGPHEGEQFRCGTGFTKEQRKEFWDNGIPTGTVAKIKSFPIGVKDAPRFPVWLGWRSREDFE